MSVFFMRPNGAYKLLATLTWGYHPGLFTRRAEGERLYIHVGSIRKLARFLGSQSNQIREWLVFLSRDLGVVSDLQYETHGRGQSVSLSIKDVGDDVVNQ